MSPPYKVRNLTAKQNLVRSGVSAWTGCAVAAAMGDRTETIVRIREWIPEVADVLGEHQPDENWIQMPFRNRKVFLEFFRQDCSSLDGPLRGAFGMLEVDGDSEPVVPSRATFLSRFAKRCRLCAV